MKDDYYTPNSKELLAAIREQFGFLIFEYGYVESVRGEMDPYSILFRRGPVEVLVFGHSYGSLTAVDFRIRKDSLNQPEGEFGLYWLTSIRRPDLLEWQFPEQRGQLVQLPKLAQELRIVADDVLRGDLSILPQVYAKIASAKEADERAGKKLEFERADVRSQEAFRAGQYGKVIAELEGQEEYLTTSARKRLEIAKKRSRRS